MTLRQLFIASSLISTSLAVSAETVLYDFEQDQEVQLGAFELSGNGLWAASSSGAISGSVSIQSPYLEDFEASSVSITVTDDYESVAFDLRVDSELGYDFLYFYINDEPIESWSGSTEVISVSYALTGSADYELTWVYSKDDSVSEGEDRAWLDNIYLQSSVTELGVGVDANGTVDFESAYASRQVKTTAAHPWTISADAAAPGTATGMLAPEASVLTSKSELVMPVSFTADTVVVYQATESCVAFSVNTATYPNGEYGLGGSYYFAERRDQYGDEPYIYSVLVPAETTELVWTVYPNDCFGNVGIDEVRFVEPLAFAEDYQPEDSDSYYSYEYDYLDWAYSLGEYGIVNFSQSRGSDSWGYENNLTTIRSPRFPDEATYLFPVSFESTEWLLVTYDFDSEIYPSYDDPLDVFLVNGSNVEYVSSNQRFGTSLFVGSETRKVIEFAFDKRDLVVGDFYDPAGNYAEVSNIAVSLATPPAIYLNNSQITFDDKEGIPVTQTSNGDGVWQLSNTKSYNGKSSLKTPDYFTSEDYSGATQSALQTITLEVSEYSLLELAAWVDIGDEDRFTIKLNEITLSSWDEYESTEWEVIKYYIEPGTYTLTLDLSKTSSTFNGVWVDAISLTSFTTPISDVISNNGIIDFETEDGELLAASTYGNMLWEVSNEQAADGAYSVGAGNNALNADEGIFEFGLSVTQSAVLTFDYLELDDANWRFELYVNDEVYALQSSQGNWDTYSIILPAGDHTLAWHAYYLGTDTPVVGNKVFVDNITVTEIPNQQVEFGDDGWTSEGDGEGIAVTFSHIGQAIWPVNIDSQNALSIATPPTLQLPYGSAFDIDYEMEMVVNVDELTLVSFNVAQLLPADESDLAPGLGLFINDYRVEDFTLDGGNQAFRYVFDAGQHTLRFVLLDSPATQSQVNSQQFVISGLEFTPKAPFEALLNDTNVVDFESVEGETVYFNQSAGPELRTIVYGELGNNVLDIANNYTRQPVSEVETQLNLSSPAFISFDYLFQNPGNYSDSASLWINGDQIKQFYSANEVQNFEFMLPAGDFSIVWRVVDGNYRDSDENWGGSQNFTFLLDNLQLESLTSTIRNISLTSIDAPYLPYLDLTTFSGSSLTLNGVVAQHASPVDLSPASEFEYAWQQLPSEGPDVTITNGDSASPTITFTGELPQESFIWLFEVSATHSNGESYTQIIPIYANAVETDEPNNKTATASPIFPQSRNPNADGYNPLAVAQTHTFSDASDIEWLVFTLEDEDDSNPVRILDIRYSGVGADDEQVADCLFETDIQTLQESYDCGFSWQTVETNAAVTLYQRVNEELVEISQFELADINKRIQSECELSSVGPFCEVDAEEPTSTFYHYELGDLEEGIYYLKIDPTDYFSANLDNQFSIEVFDFPTKTTAVEGLAITRSGESVGRVDITLETLSTNKTETFKSTSRGAFFRSLQKGQYRFTFSKDEFDDVVEEITVSAADEGGRITLLPVMQTVNTDPELTVPDAITVEAENAQGTPATSSAIATFLASATATDEQDGTLSVANNAPTTFPLGQTAVTFTATDSHGVSVTGSSTVEVQDTLAPVLSLPDDLTITLQQGNSFSASESEIGDFISAASAEDIVSGVVGVSNDLPEVDINLGTTVVTFTASDQAGNTATATASIILQSLDNDSDGISNETEAEQGTNPDSADTDNDGIEDSVDGFPNISLGELTDSDFDGIPNSCDATCLLLGMIADSDDDNDGIPDESDLFPEIPITGFEDFDGDGAPDNCDASCLSLGMTADDDDDNDGIPDLDDINPKDPLNITNRPSEEGDLILPSGVTGVAPMIFAFDSENSVYTATSMDGFTRISWTGEFSSVELFAVPDMNGDGLVEYGLFGVRSDSGNAGRYRFFVKDAVTDTRINVYNWVANWTNGRMVLLPDLTGDGVVEIALQGTFFDGDRPQLVIRNGATAQAYQTYSFPSLWESPEYMAFSDVTGDGVNEIALFGRITKNGKPQVKIIDGTDRNNRLSAYTFPDKWDEVSWHNLGDYNNDGEDDWGLLGHAKADGRWQLIVKDGTEPRGALAIYAWPDMSNTTLVRVADSNGDGVPEIALGGLNTKGRWQLQIKDGQDRNNTIKNITWPANGLTGSLHVMGDLDGDGKDELALLEKEENDVFNLNIKLSKEDYATEATFELSNDWEIEPTISGIDVNGDGVIERLAWGRDINGNVKVLQITLE